jgi:hypothetical protein
MQDFNLLIDSRKIQSIVWHFHCIRTVNIYVFNFKMVYLWLWRHVLSCVPSKALKMAMAIFNLVAFYTLLTSLFCITPKWQCSTQSCTRFMTVIQCSDRTTHCLKVSIATHLRRLEVRQSLKKYQAPMS